MAVGVGDVAPDFTLPGVFGETEADYTLSSYRGDPVVLVFYPGDSSPVCTRQLNSYNDNLDQFADTGATILSVSPQSVESHIKFSCKQGGFEFPMLADTDKSVGSSYGILGPLGLYRRSIFVIDAAGTIAYAHRAITGATYRSANDLVAVLKAME